MRYEIGCNQKGCFDNMPINGWTNQGPRILVINRQNPQYEVGKDSRVKHLNRTWQQIKENKLRTTDEVIIGCGCEC